MEDYTEVFVGIDTSKLRNAIAIAGEGRQGEIRYLGEIDNTPEATGKLVAKLAQRYQKLHFCYEASLTASQTADSGPSFVQPCAAGAAEQAPGDTDSDALTHSGDRVRDVALGAGGENLWVCNLREWQVF